VDKLDAVVGNELSGIASPMSSLAFAPAPDFAFTDFPFLGQPQAGGSPVPSSPVPVLATMPQIEPEAKKLPASISATRAPSELERRLKRVFSDPVRSRPVTELVDRLIRDMQQSKSKVLAFVGMGTSGDSHLPILQAAMVLAERRSRNVLLVDGDVERRSLSKGLEYGSCPGLGEVIAGKIDIKTGCQPTATKQLLFLPAGQVQSMADVSAAKACEAAIGQLKSDWDCVLIEAGSADGSAAAALAQSSDATYLVIELGAVETNAAQAALARLRAGAARVLGCIAI
jgi:Mrp family chromosome partitioning ATPase